MFCPTSFCSNQIQIGQFEKKPMGQNKNIQKYTPSLNERSTYGPGYMFLEFVSLTRYSKQISWQLIGQNSCQDIGSPETRVFILVALARVNVSHWFNIMARLAGFCRK